MSQAQQDDYADDVQDPNAVQAGITADDQSAIVHAGNFSQRNAAVQQAGGNLIGQGFSQMTGDQSVGDPRVVQARKIQSAMSNIIQQANAGADPNESPIDRQERIAIAVAAGMAGISPQIAIKANMQAVALQEARTQQNYLTANTNKVKQVTEDDQTNLDLKKLKANYLVYGSIPGKDGLPVYKTFGQSTQLYNADGTKNPDFAKQMQANIAAAKAAGVNPLTSTTDEFENSKANVAQIRGQAQATAADKRAQGGGVGLKPDAIANAAVLGVIAPNQITRLGQKDKEAILNFMADKGIYGTDIAAAQSQMRSLNAAAVAIGTRTGNITNMSLAINGKDGLADQVIQALNGVDRTRFPAINAGIIAMKQATGSPAEAKYHVAMQGLVTEYARVISGGTGITTDEARKQASDLLSTAGNPEAVKAAVIQMKDKELQAIKNGSDQAIELIAHPERYGAITRLQNKAGVAAGGMLGMDPDSPVTYSGSTRVPVPTPTPPQLPTPKPPAPASTGWGRVMKISANTPPAGSTDNPGNQQTGS